MNADNKTAGFTLTEMIVVMAILALLIALIVPGLEKARDRADTVRCASNLRTLAAAGVQYEMANNGRLPDSNINNANWRSQLSSLMGITLRNWRDDQVQTAFTCPTQFKIRPAPSTYGISRYLNREAGSTLVTRAHYTVPKRTQGDRGYSDAREGWLTSLTPASIPYFTDGIAWNALGYRSYRSGHHHDGNLSAAILWPLNFPHDDGANIAFLDGHVSLVKRGEGYFQHPHQLHLSTHKRVW